MRSTPAFTLAQRLYVLSGALVVALVALALVVWTLLQGQVDHAQSVADKRVPQLQRIAEIELNVTRASLQLRHAMLARNPHERKEALDDIADKKQTLDRTLAEFGDAMSTQPGREAFKPMPGLAADFWRVAARNLELIEQDRNDEAFAHLVEQTIPARNRLLEPLTAERDRQGERLNAEVLVVRDKAVFARNWVVGIVLLVSLGMAAFALYVVRTMQRLGGEPEELKRVADAVSAGDLRLQVPVRPGDTSSVMASLGRMAAQLSSTVKAVRQNAESVATASAQIASGNADLSTRTERQASSLQQTASSMEALGDTVRQNADHARQANQLAVGSSTVAAQGGKLVQEVVATMREINESSRKIADITGVIDSIAFQTNILALNAAVEAARAGEQGRGFAVVASEVRSLAQRSAGAAREIKGLITASVERVESGSRIVDEAGQTMQEIVASIRRVTDIVGEISAASTAQSEGVVQVGEAVTQMDEATQQNAALVEQSAAAADSLRQQSQELVQTVAVFKLA